MLLAPFFYTGSYCKVSVQLPGFLPSRDPQRESAQDSCTAHSLSGPQVSQQGEWQSLKHSPQFSGLTDSSRQKLSTAHPVTPHGDENSR